MALQQHARRATKEISIGRLGCPGLLYSIVQRPRCCSIAQHPAPSTHRRLPWNTSHSHFLDAGPHDITPWQAHLLGGLLGHALLLQLVVVGVAEVGSGHVVAVPVATVRFRLCCLRGRFAGLLSYQNQLAMATPAPTDRVSHCSPSSLHARSTPSHSSGCCNCASSAADHTEKHIPRPMVRSRTKRRRKIYTPSQPTNSYPKLPGTPVPVPLPQRRRTPVMGLMAIVFRLRFRRGDDSGSRAFRVVVCGEVEVVEDGERWTEGHDLMLIALESGSRDIVSLQRLNSGAGGKEPRSFATETDCLQLLEDIERFALHIRRRHNLLR